MTSYFDALRCERSWQSWNMQCWRRYPRPLLLNFNTIEKKKKTPTAWLFRKISRRAQMPSVKLCKSSRAMVSWTRDKHKANLSHIKRRTSRVSVTPKPRGMRCLYVFLWSFLCLYHYFVWVGFSRTFKLLLRQGNIVSAKLNLYVKSTAIHHSYLRVL